MFADDAVSFIYERFGAFFKEPLKSFSVFDFKGFNWPSSDADDNAEYHRFGVDAIDKIIDHFSLIFEEEEILRMKQQCLYYDPSYSLTKMFHLHSICIKIVEIMLVFSVSTAAVEHSFSTYNLIVTVLRNALTQGAKEKLMHISSTSPSVADFDGSEVLSYWKELSKQDVKLFGYSIPSIYNVSNLVKE